MENEANELYRSIGVEKTIQIRDYEPTKYSSYIRDIPPQVWLDPENSKKLFELLLVDIYLAMLTDKNMRDNLKEVDDPFVELETLRTRLISDLNFIPETTKEVLNNE